MLIDKDIYKQLSGEATPGIFIMDGPETTKIVKKYTEPNNFHKFCQNIKKNAKKDDPRRGKTVGMFSGSIFRTYSQLAHQDNPNAIDIMCLYAPSVYIVRLDNLGSNLVKQHKVSESGLGTLALPPYIAWLSIKLETGTVRRDILEYLQRKTNVVLKDRIWKHQGTNNKIRLLDKRFRNLIRNNVLVDWCSRYADPKIQSRNKSRNLTYLAIRLIDFLRCPYHIYQTSSLVATQQERIYGRRALRAHALLSFYKNV